MLRCPICKMPLTKTNTTYKCDNNHSFDIAKKGYTNLLLNHPNSGDNKEMVDARLNFLSNSYYLPLKEEIEKIIKDNNIKVLGDFGCGVGYYTKDLDITLLGFDISKEAINKASSNKRGMYFVASTIDAPLLDEVLDGVLVIFAPTFENEIYRVLKEGGLFIQVTPGKYHLFELKEALYDNPYLNTDKEEAISKLKLINSHNLKYQKLINKDDILNLIKMTPYFYKTDKDRFNKINSDLLITIDFNISIYKK